MTEADKRFAVEHVPALSEFPRVARFKQRIEESPADRVAHALMDALRDFAVAIWNERSPDDRAQFARVIADAQTELLKSQATLETLHVLPR